MEEEKVGKPGSNVTKENFGKKIFLSDDKTSFELIGWTKNDCFIQFHYSNTKSNDTAKDKLLKAAKVVVEKIENN